jgi:uncharacterized protein (UPF0335 family)
MCHNGEANQEKEIAMDDIEMARAAQDFAESLVAEDATYRVTGEELRQFVERIERLEAEKKELAEQQKEVMAEAKSRGYDVKILKVIIAQRKRSADDLAEEEAILEMYKEALGM